MDGCGWKVKCLNRKNPWLSQILTDQSVKTEKCVTRRQVPGIRERGRATWKLNRDLNGSRSLQERQVPCAEKQLMGKMPRCKYHGWPMDRRNFSTENPQLGFPSEPSLSWRTFPTLLLIICGWVGHLMSAEHCAGQSLANQGDQAVFCIVQYQFSRERLTPSCGHFKLYNCVLLYH